MNGSFCFPVKRDLKFYNYQYGNSLNRLKDMKISIRDRLDFCVNVKEFLCLFVTREKHQYFYVNQVCKGV